MVKEKRGTEKTKILLNIKQKTKFSNYWDVFIILNNATQL